MSAFDASRGPALWLVLVLGACSENGATAGVDSERDAADDHVVEDHALGDHALGDAVAADAAGDASTDPELPRWLSETGLYSDIGSRALADGVVPYGVRYELWADGAEKARFFRLPPGERIDTSDMDNWTFPIGTKAWKEFRKDGKLVETRLLEKQWDDPNDGWLRVAYVWNDAETDAEATPAGAVDARGTTHDVPTQEDCKLCHFGVEDDLIGVSAIQLSAGGTGSLSKFASDGLLSDPPASEFEVPGQGVVKDALGYLHGNCGHCHNDTHFLADIRPMRLRLRVADTTPEQTPTYQTAINAPMAHDMPGVSIGVVPGDPDASQLYVRMATRELIQMPPFATSIVDTTGTATVRAWIEGLPP